MATFVDVNRVKYETLSGVQAPLCRLYFCRHCLKLRSSECVSHEVDSLYCPNCLENMHINEAALKKYRCVSCFDCPSCHHTMSTRATTLPLLDKDNPGKTKKVYYLACAFCRWTSRDVGIEDQLVASGGWPEQHSPHQKRIGQLLDYYRALAQREKADKDKKKYMRRRSYLHLSKSESPTMDKFGLGQPSRRRSALSQFSNLSMKDEDVRVEEVEASVATEEVEQLPDDVYTQPHPPIQVTTVAQRHANAEFQPETTASLYPKHKRVLTKCSQRCRECEHNLSKPDFNPCSIKFKIQLVAVQNVPEIKLLSQPELIPEKESQVTLTLMNPLDTTVHVTLLPDDQQTSTAQVELPSCELVLPPRDDAIEFDDSVDQQPTYQDDPSVMVFRKGTKIGFLIKVTPMSEVDRVKVSLQLRYDYRCLALMTPGETSKDEVVWLQHRVLLDLGPLVPHHLRTSDA